MLYMVKYDICRQPYVESLAEGYFRPTLDYFHQHGKKHIGMEYLVYSMPYDYFYIRKVTERVTAREINDLINLGLVFIHPTHIYLHENRPETQ